MRGVHRCKVLGRAIKARRKVIKSTIPRASLPPKPVADELVECYLRTSESIYRVLHIPTFRSEYEAFWASDSQEQTTFLAILKLVLAIGATTYDDRFSLRASAVQWVLETQAWVADHTVKIRPSIQTLQLEILLLISREETKVRWSKAWISAGSLYRAAIYQGLNQDPAQLPRMPLFVAEMRRRLWNTVLELNLQMCMTTGGLPLISLDDFNAEPPSNFDDGQLLDANAVAKPEFEFTQSSAAIALRKTFAVRLAIAKLLNNVHSGRDYEEALRLDQELKSSFKALRKPFPSYNCGSGPRPSKFQLDALDFIIYRYKLGLHIPFMCLSIRDTRYAYSRAAVVEASLKLWHAAWPSPAVSSSNPSAGPNDKHTISPLSERNDMARLIMCGCSLYHVTAMMAGMLLLLELRASLYQGSLAPAPPRPDLLAAVTDCKKWSLDCIRTGHTNCKGYFLVALSTAEISGLRQRLGKDELSALLLKALEEAEDECMPILEGFAAQGELDTSDEVMTYNMPSDDDDDDAAYLDWNFLVSLSD